MIDVVWSDVASEHLEEIITYIDRFDSRAAAHMAAKLYALGQSLTYFPHRGRLTKAGHRELTTVPPYVLRYSVRGDQVIIRSVRHAARRPLD